MKMRFLITFLLLVLLTAGCTRSKPRTEVPDIMEAAWWSGLDEAEMERPDEYRLRSALSQNLDVSPSPRNRVVRKWLDSLPGPSPTETPLPLAIAIVTEDRRPVYYEGGLFLTFLPLVPYSQSSSGGGVYYDPYTKRFDYGELIPLFVAHGLRKSAAARCANCEESREVLGQYELVLTLIVREACTSRGLFLYGLSVPGDLLWFAGLPAARVAATFEINWTLSAVSTGEELARGEYRYRKSAYMNLFYYGWGAQRVTTSYYPKKPRHLFHYPKSRKFLLPGVAEDIVSDVVKAIRRKPQIYWETLAQEHEKWRQAKGERLTYKRH